MKKLQELTLFDKFLFDETMDIPEAHEAVLQIIFGDDNLKLLTPAQTEKEIRTAAMAAFYSSGCLCDRSGKTDLQY